MNRYKFLTINFLLSIFFTSSAQNIDSWLVGDGSDLSTNHTKGLVLAGGGTDNDDAMTWMLQQADGGDVVVIRTSGNDGYNDYFYNQLGINLHSVETFRINNANGASDPYLLQKVAEAEVVFIAGGDQTSYYDYWQGSLLQDTLNYLINVKEITIGGTSAGMMILGQYQYIPQNLGILSSEALSNPYHNYMDTIHRNDFLSHPLLENTINDSHFDNDDRAGRLSAFMARMTVEDTIQPKGIAANEVTAIAVDENNIAHIFGEYPTYDDFAYFVKAHCPDGVSSPENCTPGQALHWINDSTALQVYKVPGTPNGSNTFDLNSWTSGNGGTWHYWFVDQGTLNQIGGDDEICTFLDVSEEKNVDCKVYPNPAATILFIDSNVEAYNIYNFSGKLVYTGKEKTLNVADWKPGIYAIQFKNQSKSQHINWIKE